MLPAVGICNESLPMKPFSACISEQAKTCHGQSYINCQQRENNFFLGSEKINKGWHSDFAVLLCSLKEAI